MSYLYTGGVRIDTGGGVYVTTRKLDKADGSGIWAVDHGAIVYSIAVDGDGNVYTGGARTNVIGGTYATLRKYDASGNLLWSVDTGAEVYGVAVNTDGNVAVAIYVWNGPDAVRLYDADGDNIWMEDSPATYCNAVDLDTSNNVYVAGYRLSAADVEAFKYNESGTLLWSATHKSTLLAACSGPSGVMIAGGYRNNGIDATYSSIRLFSAVGALVASVDAGTVYGADCDGTSWYMVNGNSTDALLQLDIGTLATEWSDHDAALRSVAVDPDGMAYVGGARASNLTTHCYEVGGASQWSVDHGGTVYAVAADPGRWSGGWWSYDPGGAVIVPWHLFFGSVN